LAGNPKLAGDFGLADTSSQQIGGTQPASLELFALSLCRKTARDDRHPPILPRQSHSSNSTAAGCQVNLQNPLAVVC
jgi:hypothetical protein